MLTYLLMAVYEVRIGKLNQDRYSKCIQRVVRCNSYVFSGLTSQQHYDHESYTNHTDVNKIMDRIGIR